MLFKFLRKILRIDEPESFIDEETIKTESKKLKIDDNDIVPIKNILEAGVVVQPSDYQTGGDFAEGNLGENSQSFSQANGSGPILFWDKRSKDEEQKKRLMSFIIRARKKRFRGGNSQGRGRGAS